MAPGRVSLLDGDRRRWRSQLYESMERVAPQSDFKVRPATDPPARHGSEFEGHSWRDNALLAGGAVLTAPPFEPQSAVQAVQEGAYRGVATTW